MKDSCKKEKLFKQGKIEKKEQSRVSQILGEKKVVMKL